MKKLFLIFTLLGMVIAQSFAAENSESVAIIAAAKSYVTANSGMSRIHVTVEKVEGNFARAKVTPEDKAATDPAWVFLKKNDGKWIGVTLGTAFSPEDYRQFGIPKALRIK
jgi:hypothetical protein